MWTFCIKFQIHGDVLFFYRVLYKIIAPSSNPGQAQTCGLRPEDLRDSLPTRRGKKIVEYFWFPVDGDNEK